ncbi:small peptidoglycan-associated lipoprotein [Robertmurraya sp. DFI.2.37]|uniref:small peptidoglycan-associated lipoprotein n=1 Tax=Robertmurraya sp. DFI.2.37 TaxID=3031819 RepID=UPI001244CB4F|nr:small peptidoglycan-associated lipoprotein [Robertmurraya sp. DFI.2.37]MDF1506749.1 small peptidoglycan-associated lipoprotein [Robertmurraya sp. DFI.2.37]
MKFAPIIMILFMLIPACQKNDAKSFEIDSSDKQVLFFSNETEHANLQIEAPYYDAIIELRQRFPEEFNEIKTFAPTTDKAIFTKLKVEVCPAIIVLHNDKVLVQVAGESSKEEILQPIEAALMN